MENNLEQNQEQNLEKSHLSVVLPVKGQTTTKVEKRLVIIGNLENRFLFPSQSGCPR